MRHQCNISDNFKVKIETYKVVNGYCTSPYKWQNYPKHRDIYILFCYNKMFSLSAATNIDILRVCRGLHITLPLLTILIRHNFLSEPGVYNIMTN